MRNLKKFLALVLAMMMVFGLMVTANAADTVKSYDEFTDAGSGTAKYQEAMEVIIDLGVLQGYGGSDLMVPDGNLSRAELATILYRMYTGKVTTAQENADNELALMAEYSRFEDVDPASGEWYVKYVNYAAWKGWLNGYDNVKFGPYDSLTTVQMLTAVMRVLGIKVTDTGNWTMDTIQAAYENKLVGSLDLSELQAPKATREQIANVALTAMIKTTATKDAWKVYATSTEMTNVTPELESSYPTKNAAVKAVLEVAADVKANVMLDVDFVVENEPVPDQSKSLGYSSFKLESKTDYDEYGNPSTIYTKGGTVLAAFEASSALEFDKPVTGAYLRDELGIDAKITTKVVSAADSEKYPTWAKSAYATVVDGKINSATYGGYGIHVTIYKDDKANTDEVEYTAVAIVPVLSKVTGIKAVKASASEAAHNVYTLDGIDVELIDYTGAAVSGKEQSNIAVNGTVKKDDYVLVNLIPAQNKKTDVDVYEITPVDTIEDIISGYNNNTKQYTIDGDKYYASDIVNLATGTNDAKGKLNTKTDVIIALDADENVICTLPGAAVEKKANVEADNEIEILFALHSDYAQTLVNNRVVDTAIVTGITTSGKLVSRNVCATEAGEVAEETAGDVIDSPEIVVLVEDDTRDGYYVLYKLDDLDPDDDKDIVDAITTVEVDTSDDDVLSINGTPVLVDGTLYADAATKYYVAQYVDEDGDPSSDNTDTPAAPKSYTGYAAMRSLMENTNVFDSTWQIAAAAIDLDGDQVADVVFLDAYDAEATYDYAYILSDYERQGNNFYYDAIVGGTEKTLTLSGAISSVTSYPALVRLTTAPNGKVTGAALTAGTIGADEIFLNHEDVVYSVSGTLMRKAVNGGTPAIVGTITATTPVYIYNGGELSKSTTLGAVGSFSGMSVVFQGGISEPTAVYVDETAERVTDITVGSTDVEVGSVKKGEKIAVTGDGELLITGNVEAEADITTDDISKVKKPAGTTWNEAVKYKPGEGKNGEDSNPNWGAVENGSLFVMNGGDAGKAGDTPYSNSNRTEFCFVFSTDADHGTYTITLTHGDRTLTWTKEEDTEGKYLEMVCPAEINDGANNEYEEDGEVILKDGDNNKLDVGYWNVSVKDSAGHPLFTGGFTVKAADRVLGTN